MNITFSTLLRSFVPLFVGLLFLASVSGKAGGFTEGTRVHYSVSIPDPATEMFSVTADIYGVALDTMTFYFPVWAPGAYDIVNFGTYVENFSATSGVGNSLEAIRVDKNTWKIVSPGDHVRLQYSVQDIETLENSAWFGLSDIEDSTDVAFAVGTALFGYPEGYLDIPYTVTYTPPSDWGLAVALDPVEGMTNTFSAPNYDELVDAPVQMGDFQRYEFEVNGIPHIITVKGPEKLEPDVGEYLVRTTRQVVDVMSDFFGEMPYKRYLFQIFLDKPKGWGMAYGALEHTNSSTYLMPFFSQQSVVDMLEPVIAHEYWHLWSPKRIHVDELGPFNYQAGPETTSLWFHEGLTEYYARLLLVRHNLHSQDEFLSTFGDFIDRTYGVIQHEPITKLSAELTTRPTEDIMSLYTKGPLLGLLLDTEIRLQTGNKKSLDDAFKLFNREYGDHTGGKNFDDNDIVPIIEKATGTSLREFFQRYIAGTEELPVEELLPQIGLRLVVVPDVGARMTRSSLGGWKIVKTSKRGSMPASGLRKGDHILGFTISDNAMQRVSTLGIKPYSLTRWLGENVGSGESISVTYVRDGVEDTVPFRLQWDFRRLGIDPNASGEALELRKSMLGF